MIKFTYILHLLQLDSIDYDKTIYHTELYNFIDICILEEI